MNKKQEKENQRQEAIDYLRTILKHHDTVYTVLKHVSRSGMMRHISVIVPLVDDNSKNGVTLRNISYYVAQALEWNQPAGDNQSIKVGGAGMDMGFHTIYTLSSVLFRQDIKDGKDAGYLLNQSWI